MNPPYDPDLEPTTTGPTELRYFNVLPAILEQVNQRGFIVVDESFLDTCYAPNVPVALQFDPRILPASTSLSQSAATWAASHNITLSRPFHLAGRPIPPQYIFTAN